jgi:hypothetical protein
MARRATGGYRAVPTTVHGSGGAPLPLRRLLLLVAVLAPAALAAPAHAAPCVDCPGGGGGGYTIHKVYSHTLTVTAPATGSVTSSPAGISCPGTCTLTESHTADCSTLSDCPADSDMPWGTYTLSASRAGSGWAAAWTGCTAGASNTCSVKLDADRTVGVSWQDVQNPSIALSSPGAGATVGRVLTAAATATDNDSVSRVEFLVDGVLKATDTTAPYGATIDTSAYADGSTHTVAARAIDPSGRLTQVSHAVTIDHHVDLTVGDLSPFTNAQAVALTIATDPDAAMTCRLDDGPAAPCSGTFSPVDGATPDGAHAYTVVATDAVGNVASATRDFVLDRTLPALAITDGPPEGAAITTASATVSFNASDANLAAVTCAIDGGAPAPCTTATSEVLQGLPAGDHTLTIAATDKAGNSTQRVRTFSIQAPQQAQPGQTSGGTPVATAVAPQRVRLLVRASVRGPFTRLRRLVLQHLPRGGVVQISCRGHGCPRQSMKLRSRKGGSLSIKVLLRRRLRAGARLRFRITAAGRAPQTLTLRIRRARRPLVY